jgi:hypothetical protein
MNAVIKQPFVAHPRMSVKSAAKFFELKGVEQYKLLHDQKFPRQAPQVFKRPYYGPPMRGIRAHFEGNPAGILEARSRIESIANEIRRQHCHRALDQFLESDLAKRHLSLLSNKRYTHMLNSVEFRLSPELFAMEGDELRIIYLNVNAAKQDSEQAKKTLEIASWLLEREGVKIKPRQIEFFDLAAGVWHRISKPRAKTLKDLEENAKLMARMWPTIEP